MKRSREEEGGGGEERMEVGGPYSGGRTGGSGRRPGARARGGTAAARPQAPPRTPACPRVRPPRQPAAPAAGAVSAPATATASGQPCRRATRERVRDGFGSAWANDLPLARIDLRRACSGPGWPWAPGPRLSGLHESMLVAFSGLV